MLGLDHKDWVKVICTQLLILIVLGGFIAYKQQKILDFAKSRPNLIMLDK